MSELKITKEQRDHIFDAIEKNYNWIKEKGLKIDNERLFIENIIAHLVKLSFQQVGPLDSEGTPYEPITYLGTDIESH